jgi:hypothetical protein
MITIFGFTVAPIVIYFAFIRPVLRWLDQRDPDSSLGKAYRTFNMVVLIVMFCLIGGGIFAGVVIYREYNFAAERKNGEELAKAEEAKKKEEAVKQEWERWGKEQLLRDALTIDLKDKGILEKEYDRAGRYNEYITFTLRIHNRSEKDIEGVKGTVEFRGWFDELIGSVNLSYDGGVPVNQFKEWPGQFEYKKDGRVARKFAATPLQKLRVIWVPKLIIFKDGSRLE